MVAKNLAQILIFWRIFAKHALSPFFAYFGMLQNKINWR
jgi:hypothetical protein